MEDLREALKDNNPATRAKAVAQLTSMASEGDDEAAEVLREVLEVETDQDVLQKVFLLPIQTVGDKRRRLFLEIYSDSLYIMPLLERLSGPGVRSLIIERAKEVVDVFEADGNTARGAFRILAELLDHDEMFAFVDICLRKYDVGIDDIMEPLKNCPTVLQKIVLQLSTDPNPYTNNFVKIFNWFLHNPHPATSICIGVVWKSLPSNFKEATRLYYQKEMERFYKHLDYMRMMRGVTFLPPSKHPLLQWLEGFERGVATSSPSSFSALQMVAEKIGLHFKDEVRQIETEESSPITERKKRREEQRGEDLELIPIDKYLGEYFPAEQLIKLYMQEIRNSAKSLNVDVDALKRVVELHEAAHAIVHLGRDAEGRNFNTGAFNMVDGGADPSPLHETLAQLLCYHSLRNDPELLECFEKLNKRQPRAYTLWKNFEGLSLERVRNILVGMREGRIEPSFSMFERLVIT